MLTCVLLIVISSYTCRVIFNKGSQPLKFRHWKSESAMQKDTNLVKAIKHQPKAPKGVCFPFCVSSRQDVLCLIFLCL